MAVKVNAPDVSRAEMLCIFPQHIILGDTGRKYGHSPEDVAKRVKSFEDHGQLENIIVRKIEDNKVCLIAGYGRHAAALAYNEKHPDKPMKLKCTILNCNEEEAFLANIAENNERKANTYIDDAHNHEKLRRKYGYTDTKIAEIYNSTPGEVGNLKKVLSLSEDLQRRCHNGEYSRQAAIALAEVPEEKRLEVIKVAEEKKAAEPQVGNKRGRKSTVSSILVTEVKNTKIASGKGSARTIPEVRKYFEKLADTATSPNIQTFSELVLAFLGGKIDENTFNTFLIENIKDVKEVA